MMKKILPIVVVLFVVVCALPSFGGSVKLMLDKASELKWEAVNKVKKKKYDEALLSAEKALALTKRALGEEDGLVAECLAYVGWVYEEQKQYETAVKYYEQTVDLYKKTDGPHSANVALYEQRVGLQYRNLEQYDKAEIHYKAALKAARKAHGPKHHIVSDIHNHLGIMFRGMGNLDKAESHYMKALDVRKRPFAPPDASVAAIKANLAYLYQERGKPDEALKLHKSALDMREKTLGSNHLDVAASLNDIAQLHNMKGEYARALPLYKRAVQIATKRGKTQSPLLAEYLGNLGALYFVLGDWDRAQKLKKQALKISVTTLGDDHLASATHANNLAVIYDSVGKHTEAKPLFEWALKVREKELGPDHAHVGVTLHNLAKTHSSLENYAEAEPMLLRALAIWEKELGPVSREAGVCHYSLADAYDNLDDDVKAEEYYRKSILILTEVLGPLHQDVGSFQYLFAEFLARRGRDVEAIRGFHKAQVAEMASLRSMSSNISEKWLTEYLTTRRHMLVAYLSLVGENADADPAFARQALDIWLARKGIILDARMQFRRKMVASDNYKANRVFKELSKVRAELSYLGTTGQGAANNKRMNSLIQKKGELEDKLAHLSQSFAKGQARTKADTAAVADALPAGTALVDIARIDKADFENMRWNPAHYLAFVLPAGQPDKVKLVDLGMADAIDALVTHYRDAVLQGQDYTSYSRQLHDIVIKPILGHLGGAKEVFFSPDGVLSFVPMEVLTMEDGRFLIEEYAFNYVTSGRDVMNFGSQSGKPGPSLVLGDPDFDLQKGGMQRTQVVRNNSSAKKGYTRSMDLRGMVFDPLPATRKEAEAVYAMISENERKTKLRLGPQALENALLSVKKPRILHLATHGFFLSDQELDALQQMGSSRGVSLQKKGVPPGTDMMASKPNSLSKTNVSYENPLLRTGLALAGANNALNAKDPRDSTGIFTAEKVLSMDLEGTELVVLSACETGMGKAKSGEGVYGLRRAFLQAGSKSLVMSMWPVPDKETLELMEVFYKNLGSGMNRGQALRKALLAQKKTVADRYGQPNPFYWGAFVFFGDPGTSE